MPTACLQSLSYLDEDFMFQLEGRYLDKAEEIKIPIHLNMAAAQIKISDYNTAIYNCSQASAGTRGALWGLAGSDQCQRVLCAAVTKQLGALSGSRRTGWGAGGFASLLVSLSGMLEREVRWAIVRTQRTRHSRVRVCAIVDGTHAHTTVPRPLRAAPATRSR